MNEMDLVFQITAKIRKRLDEVEANATLVNLEKFIKVVGDTAELKALAIQSLDDGIADDELTITQKQQSKADKEAAKADIDNLIGG